MPNQDIHPPTWVKPDGGVVACTEKIMVLDENYHELAQTLTDMIEDAVLMGCAEKQIRQAMHELIDAIEIDIKESQVQP